MIQTGLLNKAGDHNRPDPYERKSVYSLKWYILEWVLHTSLFLSATRYSSQAHEITFWGSQG